MQTGKSNELIARTIPTNCAFTGSQRVKYLFRELFHIHLVQRHQNCEHIKQYKESISAVSSSKVLIRVV